MKFHKVNNNEYPALLEVWEASVRATHYFLKEEDLLHFKPLILEQYFDAVTLRSCKNKDGEVIGFVGISEDNLEMLFVHPKYFGKGVGSYLLSIAINEFKIQKVDVNEQNQGALGFYKSKGFEIVGRSEKDGSGKPYPILHLEIKV